MPQVPQNGNGCAICPFCNLESNNLGTLRTHIENTHIESITKQKTNEQPQHEISLEPLPCEVCGLVLSNSNLLLEHAQNFHGAYIHEDPQNTCEQCDQRFETQEDLDSHLINAHDENDSQQINSYKCSKCDFDSVRLEELNVHIQFNHMSIEVNILPEEQNVIQCQQCDYKCRLNIKHQKGIQT